MAHRHGEKARYGDALELIGVDNLDAVVLATPDEQHRPQSRAARARERQLFVEKPLASTWQGARELQRLAAQAGVTLQTGFILRDEGSHRWLQQPIVQGAFGDLVLTRRCGPNPRAGVWGPAGPSGGFHQVSAEG